MKKRLLLIPMLALLVACGRDGDSDSVTTPVVNPVTTSAIKPPSWLIGTWEHKNVSSIGFRFTSDDLIRAASGTEFSYKATSFAFSVQSQSSSATEYKVVFKSATGTQTFTFRKISATEILHVEEDDVYRKR